MRASARSPLAVLFLTVFIDLLGFGIVIPILPIYAVQLKATPFEAGLLIALYSAMQFLFAPVWGRTSDRFGRRPVLMVSIFGTAVAYGLFAVASQLWVLLAARAFAGICGANISAAQAYVADVTTTEDRARGMGLIGAAFGLGFVLGPGFASLTVTYFGVRALFGLASGLALLNFISAALILPEPRTREERSQAYRPRLAAAREVFGSGSMVAVLMVVFFIVTFSFANVEGTFSLWLASPPFSFTFKGIGLTFFFIGVILVIVQGGLIGRLSRRFGEARLIWGGTALLAAGMLLLPLATTIGSLLSTVALLALGNGINNPSVSALISKSTSPQTQGEVLGLAQSFGSLGRVFGPLFGGYLFGRYGKQAPYLAGGACMVIACALAMTKVRVSRAQREPIPSS